MPYERLSPSESVHSPNLEYNFAKEHFHSEKKEKCAASNLPYERNSSPNSESSVNIRLRKSSAPQNVQRPSTSVAGTNKVKDRMRKTSSPCQYYGPHAELMSHDRNR